MAGRRIEVMLHQQGKYGRRWHKSDFEELIELEKRHKKMTDLRIYKFRLRSDLNNISMPMGAEILHVAVQHETICLWARVDMNAKPEIRTFSIIGTGHPCPPDKYIGTVLSPSQEFVWHILEKQ